MGICRSAVNRDRRRSQVRVQEKQHKRSNQLSSHCGEEETSSKSPLFPKNEYNDLLIEANKSFISSSMATDKYIFDRYDRDLLLCGYLRSIVCSDDVIIPFQIELIIKKYDYSSKYYFEFKINDIIDYCDNNGYWFAATIKLYKHSIKNKLILNNNYPKYINIQQKQNIDKINKFEGLLISYKEEYENQSNNKDITKWIFITNKNSICHCNDKICQIDKKLTQNENIHIISKVGTKNKVKKKQKKESITYRHSTYNNHNIYNPYNNNQYHQNVDWNGPQFQRMRTELNSMRMNTDFNSPQFKQMRNDLNSMKISTNFGHHNMRMSGMSTNFGGHTGFGMSGW